MNKEPPYVPSPYEVSDAEMLNYLHRAQDNGTDAFLEALATVAKAKGMESIAQKGELSRGSLYRALKAGANPRFETIDKVLSSLGITMQLTLTTEEKL